MQNQHDELKNLINDIVDSRLEIAESMLADKIDAIMEVLSNILHKISETSNEEAEWDDEFKCTACGKKPCYDETGYHLGLFCPNCGRKMKHESTNIYW